VTLGGSGDEARRSSRTLKSLPGHTAQRSFEYFAAAHEEAAQRIGDVSLADNAGEARRRPAYPDAGPLFQSPTPPPAT